MSGGGVVDFNAKKQKGIIDAIVDGVIEGIFGKHQVITVRPAKLLLKTSEVMKALNVSERTLTALIEEGRIRCVKLNRENRFNVEDVDEFRRSLPLHPRFPKERAG